MHIEPAINIEQHPLRPFLPEGAQVLMLGSFPPPREKWSMDFFYPNYINDMWRIFGLVFKNDRDYFVDTAAKTFRLDLLRPFLEEKGIALYDTACAVRRLQGNASDKFLEIVTPTDLDALLSQLPQCRAIVTTGGKATETLLAHFNAQLPKIGSYAAVRFAGRPLRLYRMPSSSRAYPLSLDKKAAYYKQMFQELFISDNP